MLTAQMTRVLTLSRTILVVADNSLVTEMPAKLKNAMEVTVPEDKVRSEIQLNVFLSKKVIYSINNKIVLEELKSVFEKTKITKTVGNPPACSLSHDL